MEFALNLGIQTYQILTNDDEVCIPRLSSILLAVQTHSLAFDFNSTSVECEKLRKN